MGTLVERLSARRTLVAGALLVVLLPLAAGLSRLQLADDALGFLPASDPDVVAFFETAETFGLLETLLVGVQAPAGQDLFTPERLQALATIHHRVAATPGVHAASSIVNVLDMTPGAEGPDVSTLLPSDLSTLDAAAAAELRARTLSRAHLVGAMVSVDADTALILVTGIPGTDLATVVKSLHATLSEPSGDLTALLGGAPVIAAAVARASAGQGGLAGLLVGVLVILLSLILGIRGTIVAFVPGAIGAAAALGLAGWMLPAVPSFAALGALVAVGAGAVAASPILHGLSTGRPLAESAQAAGAAPIMGVMAGAVAAAVLGFGTIEPLAVAGVVLASALATTAVAVLPTLVVFEALATRKQPPVLVARLAAVLGPLADSRRGRLAGGVVACVLIVASFFIAQLYSETSPVEMALERSLPSSSPAVAMMNLQRTEVGGADIVVVEVQGDLRDPHVLRLIRDLQNRVAVVPGVRSVRSIADVVELAGLAMLNRPGLPSTRAAAEDVMVLLAGNPLVGSLANEARTAGVVLVEVVPSLQVLSDLRWAVTMATVDGAPLVAKPLAGDPAAARALAEEVARGVVAAAVRAGSTLPLEASALAARFVPLAGALPLPPVDPAADRIAALLQSAVFPVDLAILPEAGELADGEEAPGEVDFAAAARSIVEGMQAGGSVPSQGDLEKKLRELFPYAAADPVEGEYFDKAARRLQQELQDLVLISYVETESLALAELMGIPETSRPVPGLAGAVAGLANSSAIVPASGVGVGGPSIAATIRVSGAPMATAAAAAAVESLGLWVVGIGTLAAVVLLLLAAGPHLLAALAGVGAGGAALYANAVVGQMAGAREPLWPFVLAASLAIGTAVAGAVATRRSWAAGGMLATTSGLGLALTGGFFVLLWASAPAAARLGAALGGAAFLATLVAVSSGIAFGAAAVAGSGAGTGTKGKGARR